MSHADIELTIDALGARGDGIGDFEGERVYVPFAAVGDRLRVRLARDGGERLVGRILAVVVPGPGRAPPPCRHFGDRPGAGCGGCAFQHLDAATYAEAKLAQLSQTLARQGVPVEATAPLAVSPPASRRRADFSASRRKEGVVLGFNARHSHRIVDLAECPILRPRLAALLSPLRDMLAPLTQPGDSAEVRLADTDSGVDLLLVTALEIGAQRRERLARFAETHDLARIARRHPKQAGAETLLERRPVRMVFGERAGGGAVVPMPPGAFLQATSEGEAALGGVVRAATAGAGRIADLYAGIGTFALPLALGGAKVHAVDAGRAEIGAIAAAARSAMLPGPTTELRDLDKRPLDPATLGGFDAVIFDPPRAGAKAQAAQLAQSTVATIVAVSCNPASFARDARLLLDGGYRLERLQPVDQFLWSPHLEVAAVFRRGPRSA
jgi:23S rRNA (uracil1939-C5)-methyltransferase